MKLTFELDNGKTLELSDAEARRLYADITAMLFERCMNAKRFRTEPERTTYAYWHDHEWRSVL